MRYRPRRSSPFGHTITGYKPHASKERPTRHGTLAEVVVALLRYREAAGVDAFQINFHGIRSPTRFSNKWSVSCVRLPRSFSDQPIGRDGCDPSQPLGL
jgi:hypothetical protein